MGGSNGEHPSTHLRPEQPRVVPESEGRPPPPLLPWGSAGGWHYKAKWNQHLAQWGPGWAGGGVRGSSPASRRVCCRSCVLAPWCNPKAGALLGQLMSVDLVEPLLASAQPLMDVVVALGLRPRLGDALQLQLGLSSSKRSFCHGGCQGARD